MRVDEQAQILKLLRVSEGLFEVEFMVGDVLILLLDKEDGEKLFNDAAKGGVESPF
jgi:hypothetical protein